jgi:hypothetical protein
MFLMLPACCVHHGAYACDTWVAMPDATVDGSVILAKNSDRPPMEAQPLVHCRRADYQPAATVKCTYIEIPQVAETYEHIGSKIWWTFGYEHGLEYEQESASSNSMTLIRTLYRHYRARIMHRHSANLINLMPRNHEVHDSSDILPLFHAAGALRAS